MLQTLNAFLGKIAVVLMAAVCLSLIAPPAQALPGDQAYAQIYNTTVPKTAMGTVELTELAHGVRLVVSLSQVPEGQHGFHIHELGSCTDAGQGAGGHYNPLAVQHGYLPEDGLDQAHAGDLGNLQVGPGGEGTKTLTLDGLSLTGGVFPIADRALILHQEADDFGQPTGNAGGRIGCGVITLAS